MTQAKDVEPYARAVSNAYKYWTNNVRHHTIDFRTWLKVKHRVFVSRRWESIHFESSEKEVMFMLRFS